MKYIAAALFLVVVAGCTIPMAQALGYLWRAATFVAGSGVNAAPLGSN